MANRNRIVRKRIFKKLDKFTYVGKRHFDALKKFKNKGMRNNLNNSFILGHT